MIKLSRNEIMHLASLSRIEVDEDEVEHLIKNLEETLTYAARVQQIASGAHESIEKNVNVFREDKVIATDSEPLLANAPKKEEQYFVVPVILED